VRAAGWRVAPALAAATAALIAVAELDAAVAVVDRLDRQGHTVIGVDLSVGRPTVQLQASARLAAMADEQRGAYYMHGVDRDGQRYRKGQLLDYRDVVVIWIERGH
jgi:hypothetical protein